jgi:pantoate--beta-alanine ligase
VQLRFPRTGVSLMEVFTTIADLGRWRTDATTPIGFVPTMGYLHAGHLSLIKRARAESSSVLVSIFVNPSQFGPGEDFQRYPRDLNRDLDLIRTTGADAVFTPSVEEMYPASASTTVEVETLSGILEGTSRPGHFRGVATIVCKLFHLVHPQLAFFGEKDYQQLKVIERMVHDLHMPIRVVGCPTIREPDGLALSSRNVYLSPPERAAATTLSRALLAAERLFDQGSCDTATLRHGILRLLAEQPLIRVDYVAVVHPHTLQPLTTVSAEGGVICLAVWLGKTRLIDNRRLGSGGEPSMPSTR